VKRYDATETLSDRTGQTGLKVERHKDSITADLREIAYFGFSEPFTAIARPLDCRIWKKEEGCLFKQ
jgi:hypothetical protein